MGVRHLLGATAVAAIVLASASAGTGSPPYRGIWKCSATSPSGHVRLWWNERRHDEQTVPERYEQPGATTFTYPPTDANCRTHPQIVRYLATSADQLLARDRALGLPAPHADTGMPARWGDPS